MKIQRAYVRQKLGQGERGREEKAEWKVIERRLDQGKMEKKFLDRREAGLATCVHHCCSGS